MIYHPPDFWRNRKILFGVSGGIAAYKACSLVSYLIQAGGLVQVVMTRNARRLIGKSTFEALTGQPVMTEMFAGKGSIQHIDLVRHHEWIVVAPATASLLGKMAAGIGDDLLTTLLLVDPKKVVVSPAMNAGMWKNPLVQRNLACLEEAGVQVLQPAAGWLACREEGAGRLPELEPFVEELFYRIHASNRLTGKKVLITTGPTREWFDPVRFLSNPSSGKMGGALAAMARAEGAEVRVVRGPVSERMPSGVSVFPVETAREMDRETSNHFEWCDVCIMAAAVSDYRPAEYHSQKQKKVTGSDLMVNWVSNPDILDGLGSRKQNQLLVGFCAETENLLDEARRKLQQKRLDLMVANQVGQKNSGFGALTSSGWMVDRTGRESSFSLIEKTELACLIFDHLSEYFLPGSVPLS